MLLNYLIVDKSPRFASPNDIFVNLPRGRNSPVERTIQLFLSLNIRLIFRSTQGQSDLGSGEMVSKRSYDCIVMGAGPAGSTVAALVAEQGYSTLLIEREKIPRFHVGESMVPESYWILERLGIVQEMSRIGFTRKNGIQFVTNDDVETGPLLFTENGEHDSSVTWHVERSKFDKLMYDTAYNRGATVVDETSITDIELRKQSPHKVTVRGSDGKDQEITAKVLVDATGMQGLIANRMDLKVRDEELNHSSIWGYYSNAARNGGSNCEVTTILHTNTKDAWFWYVPMSDGTTSVGLIGDNEFILKRRETPEQTFKTELNKCPGLKRRLQDATLASKFYVGKDFNFTTRLQAGDGWVLVGDAAGSVDPITSAGVLMALKSAWMAADAITSALAGNDLSAKRLGSWTGDYQRSMDYLRRFARVFYHSQFNLFEVFAILEVTQPHIRHLRIA
jgi:flavin-dependent dehydrogenase